MWLHGQWQTEQTWLHKSLQTNAESVPDNAALQDVHKLFQDDNSYTADESLSNANVTNGDEHAISTK